MINTAPLSVQVWCSQVQVRVLENIPEVTCAMPYLCCVYRLVSQGLDFGEQHQLHCDGLPLEYCLKHLGQQMTHSAVGSS